MISKEQRFRLGLFLVFGFFLVIASLIIFLSPQFEKKTEDYKISFLGSVSGLSHGSPVKYQGVEVGKVREIIINPKNLNSILVTVSLRKDFPAKTNMVARLQYSGITGIKYVELSGGTNEAKRIKPNSTIPTAPGLGERAEGIVSDVELAVQRVNTLLKPENQENIGLFLKNIQASSQSVKSVLASKREQFSEILNRLDTISQNLEKTSVNLSELSSSLKNRAESRQIDQLLAQSEKLLKELTLRFSEKEMGGVVTRLNELILTTHDGINKLQGTLGAQSTEINSSLTSLKESLEDISQFARQLNEDPTALVRTKKETRRRP